MFVNKFSWRFANSKTAKINASKLSRYTNKLAYGVECIVISYREDYGNKDKPDCMVIEDTELRAHLETEIHDCECEVVPSLCSVLWKVVEVVVQLEEGEHDQPQEVGPYVDCLVGEDTGTAWNERIHVY